MIHPFDTATALTPRAEGKWAGHTSPDYGNLVGPFGGFLGATILRAVLEDARAAGDPISLTVNFCAAVPDGPFTIRTRMVRAGKYVQHWSADLVAGDEIRTTATAILARRLADYSHQPVDPPNAPPPEDCESVPSSNAFSAWLGRYDFRFVEGAPPFLAPPLHGEGSARSVNWIADNPPRPLDHLSLAALSDSFLLRLFHVRGTLVPMGTVSLTTHFIGTANELAEQGTAPLLGVADAIRFHGNFHDQSMQLWSTTGQLLATGTQIVWFKE